MGNFEFWMGLAATAVVYIITFAYFQGKEKNRTETLFARLESMESQIHEMRNDQKVMFSHAERIAVLEKCTQHNTDDIDVLHARISKLNSNPK